MSTTTPSGYTGLGQVQAVPASLPRTCSPERLVEFLHRAAAPRRGEPRLGYPASYFRWLAAIPGRDRYMDAALIDDDRNIVGAAISRPLTLGMWSNVKLRAAIRDAIAGGGSDRSAKGWVRYLTREKDADLAMAMAHLLPEEHYALKAAVIEFLHLDPDLAGQGREQVLLDVILSEARAAGYDYVLCWGEDVPLKSARATRAVAAEAVLETLPEGDAGLLRLYNFARYGAQAVRLWVRARRAAAARTIRQTRLRLRKKASALRYRVSGIRRRRPGDAGKVAGAGDPGSPAGPRCAPPDTRPVASEPPPSSAGTRHPTPDTLATFDGALIRRVAGPSLPLTDDLVERLRDLMGDTQENYGIFPTYDGARLRALLTPAHDASRFHTVYASQPGDGPSILATGLGHDVLTYVATKGDQVLACLFGHRLPWFTADGQAEETWVIRAVYFSRHLGLLRRADVVQRCADAAATQYGIRRVLMLRPAGLGEHFLSRIVLGTQRRPDRLLLRYIPLSESALAEEAVLARRLPIGYI